MADNAIDNPTSARESRMVELRARLDEVDAEILHLANKDILNEAEEDRFQDLRDEVAVLRPEYEKLEKRAQVAEEIRNKTYAEIKGMPEFRKPAEEWADKDVRSLEDRVARDAARRILEARDAYVELKSHQIDAVDKSIRLDTDIARRMILTENPSYRSAFQKLMSDSNAAAYLREDERSAIRNWMDYQSRNQDEANTGHGGYAVPVLIDPSIILTDQENPNPVQAISRTVDVTTNVWKGVSSAGMSWSFDAENAEVSDDSLTSLAQPSVTVYTARGFIPFTLEIGQDWPGFQSEMARILSAGYSELLADKFVRGSGSAEPYGVRTYLETTSSAQVTSTTDGAFGQEDVYATWAALPLKYQGNASWLMSVDMMNRVRQLGTSTNFHAYTVNLMDGNLPLLFNRPVYVSSYMPNFSSTTGAATRLIVGDFSNYLIARRQGMTVELVPHLTSTGSNLPQGRRGWFAWARIGGGVVNSSAFKIQLNT